jgi:hypothetical protein
LPVDECSQWRFSARGLGPFAKPRALKRILRKHLVKKKPEASSQKPEVFIPADSGFLLLASGFWLLLF